ncbi:MAG: TrkH family potassium uptake protein [Candidatus Diapherotrites archaeon]|uniref:TrkH family potassium uptake protein n=1 Tax=Candidatus Iainarchaeum sp. TaxID=3101447 RepID=A0A8T4LF08_9ARCH|nr:TrkH family potassium uptake protein [Candidatus Diapherotrites archaeon]
MAFPFSGADFRIVFRDVGNLLQVLALGFLFPAAIGVLLEEPAFNIISFVLAGVVCFTIGRALFEWVKSSGETTLRHALVISAVVFGLYTFLAAVPIMWVLRVSFSNAFFEAMSAVTTTGLSVLGNPEILPQSVLFWRSFLGWIGGIAVVLMAMIGIFSTYSRATRLLKTTNREERVKYNFRQTFASMWKTYLSLTALGIILLLLFGMGLFDAVNYSMNAISTTGFDSTLAGVAGFDSRWIESTLILLSLLGATSFFVHYAVLNKKMLDGYGEDTQFKGMLLLGIAGSLLLFSGLSSVSFSFKQAVEYSLFSAGSAVTTAGFSVVRPIASLGEFSKLVLIGLMLIGGSAVSTAGGIKVNRVLISLRSFWDRLVLRMRGTRKEGSVHLDHHLVSESEVGEVNQFIILYILVALAGAILLVLAGNTFDDSLFEAVSAQGNVGLSSGITHAAMPLFSKIVLVLLMWIGRLEIIPLFAGVGVLVWAATNRKERK